MVNPPGGGQGADRGTGAGRGLEGLAARIGWGIFWVLPTQTIHGTGRVTLHLNP